MVFFLNFTPTASLKHEQKGIENEENKMCLKNILKM